MKFFHYFDKVFVINLQHRKDRLKLFEKEVEKYDLGNFEVFPAIDGNKIETNISLSMKKGAYGLVLTTVEILKIAIKEKYKNILIMEDDCYFTQDISNIHNLMKYVPSNWHMLYFGGNHVVHFGGNHIKPPKKINNKIVKIHHTLTAHCLSIQSVLYQEILESISKFEKEVDVYYTDFQKKYNAYCFYPSIAKQKPGYSDIELNKVDYSSCFQDNLITTPLFL